MLRYSLLQDTGDDTRLCQEGVKCFQVSDSNLHHEMANDIFNVSHGLTMPTGHGSVLQRL